MRRTGPNAGYYRSGPLGADGVVTGWRDWVAVPDWRFWENQGAGIAVADLDGDGVAELVVLAVDNPQGQNGGYYSVGWRLDERGRPADGWGPWQPVPDWRFWENQDAALAIAKLGSRAAPHLVVLAVDDPPGPNGGWYRVLDPMTDLDMAAEMGVWRLLEDDSQVLAVHAALLRTGDVLFFAGSSNDPDRHAAHQYGTAVWHYPAPRFSRPQTPVDLFCCGHAFLPDGRVLAAGGTEQYDPFFGLKQAVVFDPFDGPPDPGGPTGAAGAWTAVPDMAGGRWYPTLLPLADGRVLAVSGLDGNNELNVVPETYTDGAGWAPLPPSPHWPMYAHLFLLQDGRLFYSGGQYGANNGVRPTVWDPATNATTDLQGVLPDPQARNQSASVLLPPAQDQRVMIMGGGPFDMHDQTGAVASVAVADLDARQPGVRAGRRAEHGADASVRDPAARPHRARQRRRDDGGERGPGGAGGRDLPPGPRGRSRSVGDGGRVAGAPALPLGGPADAGRQGGHRRLEPAAQDRGAADRGVLAAVPVRGGRPEVTVPTPSWRTGAWPPSPCPTRPGWSLRAWCSREPLLIRQLRAAPGRPADHRHRRRRGHPGAARDRNARPARLVPAVRGECERRPVTWGLGPPELSPAPRWACGS